MTFQSSLEDVVHSEVRKNSEALAGLPPPLTAERRISEDVDMDPCKAGRATKFVELFHITSLFFFLQILTICLFISGTFSGDIAVPTLNYELDRNTTQAELSVGRQRSR